MSANKDWMKMNVIQSKNEISMNVDMSVKN